MTSISAPVPTASKPVGLAGFDYTLYALVVFAWSTSWIAIKYQVGIVSAEVSLVYRFALSAACMWAWLVATGRPWAFPLRHHARFVILGILLFSSNFLAFYYGGKTVPSGLLAVVFSLASVFNLVLGNLIFRTPIDRVTLIGALTGFGGVLLMFWPQISGADFDHDALIGLGFCVGGTLSFCLGNMAAAESKRAGLDTFSVTAWGMVYGTLWLALLAFIMGRPYTFDWSPAYVVGLGWLSIFSSVLAFAAYLTLLNRIGAGRAGYATVMFPVFALAISTWVEGYQWTGWAIAGLALVLAGNIFVLKRR